MTLRSIAALAAVLHAVPALAAEFEGAADFRMVAASHGKKTEGTGRIYLTPKAWRMESEMKVPESSPEARQALGGKDTFRSVVFGKIAEPGKSWMLNERTKTFTVVEAPKEEKRSERSDDDYQVTRGGKDTVAGLACDNVKVQRKGRDDVWDACFARDFASGAWLRAMRDTERDGWILAAHRVGVAGYPVRIVVRGKEQEEKFRVEFTKVERRSVPASLFEVPAGYRETNFMGTMAQSPEQQKQMEEAQKKIEEAMKNMSPEERKAVEKMMQQQGR